MNRTDFTKIASRSAIAAVCLAAAVSAAQAGGRNEVRGMPDTGSALILMERQASSGRNAVPRRDGGLYETSLHVNRCREDNSGRNAARGAELEAVTACEDPVVTVVE